MIFVTVGAQMPFDRLIQAVEAWSKQHPTEEVLAQIGPHGWRPQHMPFVEFLDPKEFRQNVEKARVVISHAGMGTILTALERGKPLLIMPRRGDLQETRNDHQIATARQLAALGRATVAYDARELIAHLNQMARLAIAPRISDHASPELLGALRAFVLGEKSSVDRGEPPAVTRPIEGDSGPAAIPASTGHGLTGGLRFQRGGISRVPADGIGTVVLLAGGTSSAGLARAAERSVLELPITSSRNLLSLWQDQLETAFAHRAADEPAEVRILGGPLIHKDARSAAGFVRIEHDHDPGELRGTGGLLHDVAAEYPDDAYLLVASASTLLLEPLGPLTIELRMTDSDVAFFLHEDGSSPNLMLIRARCLRSISPVGFVDFKEQALPQIAAASSVSIVRRARPIAVVARTPADYIRALRHYHVRLGTYNDLYDPSHSLGLNPFAEKWQSAFAIVEAGAEVEADAKVADSVVLNRARVGRGAVVVRSVVCPGAVVPAFTTVVDQVVRPRNAKAIARAIGVRS